GCPRLPCDPVRGQLLHGGRRPPRAAGDRGVPQAGRAGGPPLPSPAPAPARLGRHGGRDAPLHGRVPRDLHGRGDGERVAEPFPRPVHAASPRGWPAPPTSGTCDVTCGVAVLRITGSGVWDSGLPERNERRGSG